VSGAILYISLIKNMKQIIKTEKHPIKLWLDDIEKEALQQAKNLANLPFIFKHVAIMPDAHMGYGMPIGGVMASEKMVVPNAVGVDIGCGMCAVQTSIHHMDRDSLKTIMAGIRSAIPLGFKHHKRRQHESHMPNIKGAPPVSELPIINREYRSALGQIGTLGGGNHFIEIQRGNDGFIWLMIHSGSRNLGYRVANHYNKRAIQLNAKWKSPIPKKFQLAYLPIDSEEGQNYLAEMGYCAEFARCNRKLMMARLQDIVHSFVTKVNFEPMIHVAHNYAAFEAHFHKKVLVHRKGATRAFKGEIGIIPGSQGAASYIVRGKGNRDSFMSCSHGAGRKMGRKQAQRTLSLQDEIRKLDNQGIIHSVRSKRSLDEAAGAYKDIDTVLNNQLDLIQVVETLHPLAVVKG